VLVSKESAAEIMSMVLTSVVTSGQKLSFACSPKGGSQFTPIWRFSIGNDLGKNFPVLGIHEENSRRHQFSLSTIST